MQRTWVQSLSGKISYGQNDYEACVLRLLRPAHPRSLCSTTGEAATMRSPRTATKGGSHWPKLEKAGEQQQRPSTTKTQNVFIKKLTFEKCTKLQYLEANIRTHPPIFYFLLTLQSPGRRIYRLRYGDPLIGNYGL